MAQSGISVSPDCVTAFNELKMGKDLKWIIYKISDDWKEIVVEEMSKEDNYEVFRQKLLDAKSNDRKGKEGIGARYAVYDVQYDAPGGEGKRNKITFIYWCPDDANQYARMMYSTTKEAIRRAFNGIAEDVQANDKDDIEYDNIIAKVSKGR